MRVRLPLLSAALRARCIFKESRSLGLERKLGGKLHLKLNNGSRPIANKYHEGKVKRTLKRELKVPEIAEREANGTSCSWRVLVLSKVMACHLNASVVAGFDLDAILLLALHVNVSSQLRKTLGTW